jgi:hypothetical protein
MSYGKPRLRWYRHERCPNALRASLGVHREAWNVVNVVDAGELDHADLFWKDVVSLCARLKMI